MRLLIILMLLLPVTGFSQLIKDSYGSSGNVVGEVKEKTRMVSKLTWEMSGSDTLYIFTFANAKGATFSDHQAIVLAGVKMMNSFYAALKTVAADKNQSIKWSESGMEVSLSHIKGKVMISVEEGYCYLSEKQVDQTFGK